MDRSGEKITKKERRTEEMMRQNEMWKGEFYDVDGGGRWMSPPQLTPPHRSIVSNRTHSIILSRLHPPFLIFILFFFTENAAQCLNLSGPYRLYIFGIRQQGRGSRQQQL